jgi:DNA-binding transcriptional regulator YiaG
VLSRAEKLPGGTLETLCRLYLETVASEASSTLQGSRGEEAIERLASTLKLSYDDLGRMLGVSGETVRRWARGTGRIPDSHLATLDVVAAALDGCSSYSCRTDFRRWSADLRRSLTESVLLTGFFGDAFNTWLNVTRPH